MISISTRSNELLIISAIDTFTQKTIEKEKVFYHRVLEFPTEKRVNLRGYSGLMEKGSPMRYSKFSI